MQSEPIIPEPIMVVVDVGALHHPDACTLDALMRLQLVARRLGAAIRLRNAGAELLDLLELAGLSDVLPEAPRSGLEPQG